MKQQLLVIAFAAFVAACVPASGYQPAPAYPAYTPADGTGVFVNGEQLTIEQKAQLDQLLGESVPPGRYALDAQYNFGYEGQAPVVNLAAHAQSRDGAQSRAAAPSREPFSMYSTDSSGAGSSLVDDGNGCMIMSTPSGSLSSGC